MNRGEDDDGCLKFCNFLKWSATVQEEILSGCLVQCVMTEEV